MKKYYIFLLVFTTSFSVYAQNIYTVAGNGVSAYTGNGGQATAASIGWPEEVKVDPSGNFYISEFSTNADRKVSPAGIINADAGNSTAGFSGDGGPGSAAELNIGYGCAIDGIGNLYVCDFSNNRIRKVNVAGIISEVAGNGVGGYSGDGGQATAAEVNGPASLACDGANNVYIGDWYNNRIRKINVSTGIITTVAGTGVAGFSGDGGPANVAEIQDPEGINFDPAGNLYIADTYNYRIRKVLAGSGTIITIAGNGVSGYAGDGGQATAASFSFPRGASVDPATGNVFIADQGSQRVRKITVSTGIVTSYAGNGIGGFSGDGGPATAAEFDDPCKTFVDVVGNVYVADLFNSRIRKIGSVPLPITLMSYTGNYTADKVELIWITATESNNNYFTIERSTDGTNFSKIGQVKGAGNSSIPINYSYADDAPEAGLDYYRLTQTDLDGHSTLCGVIAVDVNNSHYSVFPNPASSVANVEFQASQTDEGQTATIKVYNMHSQLIETRLVNVLSGTNTIQLNLSNYNSGLYLITLNYGSKQLSHRMIVSPR